MIWLGTSRTRSFCITVIAGMLPKRGGQRTNVRPTPKLAGAGYPRPGGGGMLRLHFDGTDLARVRLRPPPLMIEVMYSAELLRQRLDGVLFDEWAQRTPGPVHRSVRPLPGPGPPGQRRPAF